MIEKKYQKEECRELRFVFIKFTYPNQYKLLNDNNNK